MILGKKKKSEGSKRGRIRKMYVFMFRLATSNLPRGNRAAAAAADKNPIFPCRDHSVLVQTLRAAAKSAFTSHPGSDEKQKQCLQSLWITLFTSQPEVKSTHASLSVCVCLCE